MVDDPGDSTGGAGGGAGAGQGGGGGKGGGGGSAASGGTGGTTMNAGGTGGTAVADAASTNEPDVGKADDGGSADVGTVTDPGVPVDIPSLSGIMLLLDANKGITKVGDKVSRWADQSPNHSDATNANANFQPTLVMVNGQPAIHFAGKNPAGAKNGGGTGGQLLRIMDGPKVQFGKEDWLIEYVVAYTNELDTSHNGVLGAFFGKYKSGVGEILFTGNWPYSENPNVEQAPIHLGFGEAYPVGGETTRGSHADAKNGLNDGKIRILGARRVGGKSYVRISGAQQTMKGTFSASADLSVPGANIGIGSFEANSDTGSSRALKGDVYYIIIIKGTITRRT